MIKAKSSIITINTEALLSRELPYLKYRTETLIIDVTYIRDKVCAAGSVHGQGFRLQRGSQFYWMFKKKKKHPQQQKPPALRAPVSAGVEM